MDKSSLGFKNITTKFPSLTDVKTKEGVFTDLEIRGLIKAGGFESAVHEKEKATGAVFML